MGSSIPLGRTIETERTLSINSVTEGEAAVDERVDTDRRSNSVSERYIPFLAETQRSLVREVTNYKSSTFANIPRPSPLPAILNYEMNAGLR